MIDSYRHFNTLDIATRRTTALTLSPSVDGKSANIRLVFYITLGQER